MRLARSLLTFIISIFSITISAQDDLSVCRSEDTLKMQALRISNAVSDSARLAENHLFTETLFRALLKDGSFTYPFDSLRFLSRITSTDSKFRIYTWNLPLGNGTNLYFGYLQINPEMKQEQGIFNLADRSDSIEQPETACLDHNSWYGAIYYKMIEISYRDQSFYTLLGWDGINSLITQKIIDVLTFDHENRPYFCSKIFRNFGNDPQARIFFKFSASSSMLLNYDEQHIIKEKKWNASRRQFDIKTDKVKMIVCDELLPLDPQMEGQFEYYIPSSEVFNGFIFENGGWNFHRNIDARNKAR